MADVTLFDVPRPLQRVLGDIVLERRGQDREWGGAAHDDRHTELDWLQLIEHHMARLAKDAQPPTSTERDEIRARDARVRRRLLVISSLSVAAIESGDRLSEDREARWAGIDEALAGDHLGGGEDRE